MKRWASNVTRVAFLSHDPDTARYEWIKDGFGDLLMMALPHHLDMMQDLGENVPTVMEGIYFTIKVRCWCPFLSSPGLTWSEGSVRNSTCQREFVVFFRFCGGGGGWGPPSVLLDVSGELVMDSNAFRHDAHHLNSQTTKSNAVCMYSWLGGLPVTCLSPFSPPESTVRSLRHQSTCDRRAQSVPRADASLW